MLTKRTNILFDDKLWKVISNRARREKTSVGNLVRTAVRTVYDQKESVDEKTKAFEEIIQARKLSKKVVNYKELINYGRKY